MYSLKKTLGKHLFINMMVIMLVLLLVMNFTIRALVNDYVATRLLHDVDTLISAMDYTPNTGWVLNDKLTDTVYHRVRSGHYYVIETPDNMLIRSRSLFDLEVPLPEKPLFVEKTFQMDGPGNEVWLVMQSIVYKNKQPIYVWVAEDIHLLNQQLLTYSIYLIILVLILVSISIFIHQRMLDKAFTIFDVIQTRLKSNRYETIDLDKQTTPKEIHPLLSEISLLIDRLRQRTIRTRNAIGDLSHELKRPLQLLSISIDNDENRQMEVNAIADIKTIIDRELRRAKIAGSDAIPVEFNVQQEIPYLIDVMRKIYPDIEIAMDNEQQIQHTPLDRDDMLELIGNLLDNACKYATSFVKLTITYEFNQLEIQVADDGPGIDDAQLSRITEQGVRLDESKEGHGLGLRICRDIVDSYHGKLDFYAVKSRGLLVVVKLKMVV